MQAPPMTAWSQDTPLSDPAPHAAADIAWSRSALRISQVLSDPSMAETPMPTMISRNPCTLRRWASTYTATAVAIPPSNAPPTNCA